MNSLNRTLAHTVRYLGFIIRQLAGANAHLYQKYYSASRYSALRLPQILTGLFEPAGHVVFLSGKNILFGGIPFGVTEADVRTLQGAPDCTRRDAGDSYSLQSLFYKEDVGGYRTRESVGLLDGKVFYGCHNFSRGPLLGKRDVAVIKRSLVEKYLQGEEALQANMLERFRIVDRNGNLIIFNNSVNLTISYYSGDAELKARLKTLYDGFVDVSREQLQLRRDALAGRL